MKNSTKLYGFSKFELKKTLNKNLTKCEITKPVTKLYSAIHIYYLNLDYTLSQNINVTIFCLYSVVTLYSVVFFLLFVFQAKSGTTNNHRTRSSDMSY